ncbi:MPN527 family putative ECF transporter permease subunit [Mycoplasma sp. HS2188]|uniref:MPN527 family putative ECF transporter permease subunit n=1 Tax=Mycoplasma sp. HS2188 TaxID=2976765 RepID=UPI0021AA0FB7|nr:hypothetical protein [Mycoplasma sp. HS2188]MCT4469933.1 hypothetical protein [Mycoplasma sp. HS2188]
MRYNSRRTIFKIVLSGLFLALAIITDFIGSFLPFNSFLKFNFSLVFSLAAFRLLGFRWGLLILIGIFVIGPSYSALGYDPAGLLGQGMLIISQAVFILFYLLIFKLFKELLSNHKHSKREIYANLIAFTISTFLASIALTLINLFIATPAFFYLFKYLPNASFWTLYKNYEANFKPFFFFIPNYFLGGSVVFMSFNLANYLINSIFLFGIFATFARSSFIYHLNN